MQTTMSQREINPDTLMTWLMDNVETFHRCHPLGDGICRSEEDSGRVHSNSQGIRVVYADDIDPSEINAAIASCPTEPES